MPYNSSDQNLNRAGTPLLKQALQTIDTFVHTETFKKIPSTECNQIQFISSDVLKTRNLLKSCFDSFSKLMLGLTNAKGTMPIKLFKESRIYLNSHKDLL